MVATAILNYVTNYNLCNAITQTFPNAHRHIHTHVCTHTYTHTTLTESI